ncbi:MAG: alpha/beta fold hydrolase [Parvibaculales bacterium]
MRLKNIKKRLLRWLLISLSFCAILAITGFFQYQHNAQTRAAIGSLEQIKRPSQHGEIIISFHTSTPPEAVTHHDQAVVLIPSLARPASDFNELAAALNAAGYTTYLLDPRGMHDESGVVLEDITLFDLADDVAALHAHLQASQRLADPEIILIGHAFGNRVARSFATKYTNKTDAVILLAAGGVAPLSAIAEKSLMQSLWLFMPNQWREPRLRYAFFSPTSTIPDYWIKGWRLSTAFTQAAATANTPAQDWYHAGGKPLFVIQGAQDSVAPPALSGDVLQQEFPDRVSTLTLPDAGHALLPEQPTLIEAAVLSFLRQRTQLKSSPQKSEIMPSFSQSP